MHSRGLVILVLCAMSVAAYGSAGTTWPCFHGPGRKNLSADQGLLQSWPGNGPPLLWTASGIGHGYSSVAIAANRIFLAGMIDKQTYVTSLDMTGKMLWQRINGPSWEATEKQPWAVPYSGSRGTPTVDGDNVYHLSELGRLTAFDLLTGKERWCVDVLQTFRAERPKYGLSESVLIHGDSLFCCPGGTDGYVVAVDKQTGRTRWTNTGIQDPIGYCSPVVAEIDGVEQVITMSAKRVFAFAPDSGRLLWDYAFGNTQGNSHQRDREQRAGLRIEWVWRGQHFAATEATARWPVRRRRGLEEQGAGQSSWWRVVAGWTSLWCRP